MTDQERPISFKGPMVTALLNGTKTQTRRLRRLNELNAYPGRTDGEGLLGPLGYKGLCPSDYYVKDKAGYRKNPGLYHWVLGEQGREVNPIILKCPYGQIGDLLWVKETWSLHHSIHWHDLGWEPQGLADFAIEDGQRLIKSSGVSAALTGQSYSLIYAADGYQREGEDGSWKPSIHMPRWASRILLRITDIRVERLQDITEEDAKAEGVEMAWDQEYDAHPAGTKNYTSGYCELWDHINGPGSWDANPWVWVVSFERVDGGGR